MNLMNHYENYLHYFLFPLSTNPFQLLSSYKNIFDIDLSNPTFEHEKLPLDTVIESLDGYSISIAKNPVFLTETCSPRIFRPLVVPIPAARGHVFSLDKSTLTHTHTHTFGIRFSASRADQFIDVVEGGKGRVTPWYLSPVPPGAWPKSNVVKIEIIRATTFHGNRVHPSTVSDPDNPQRPQPVNILQASFRRLEPEGVAPWRVAVTELSPPLTTRHPFSASLFGYVAISTRFRFFSRLNFWATSMKDSSRMNLFISSRQNEALVLAFDL